MPPLMISVEYRASESATPPVAVPVSPEDHARLVAADLARAKEWEDDRREQETERWRQNLLMEMFAGRPSWRGEEADPRAQGWRR